MSQESVSSIVLEKEIQESIMSSDKLLQYSKQPGTFIIPDIMATQQQQSWTSSQTKLIEEYRVFYKKMGDED